MAGCCVVFNLWQFILSPIFAGILQELRSAIRIKFLAARKLEAKKEVAASEFSHLNHSLSHRPVSVKPDISKASSAGGKLHILKPSCERNGITPTPKESLSPTSGSKVPNSPLTGLLNSFVVTGCSLIQNSALAVIWRSSDSVCIKFDIEYCVHCGLQIHAMHWRSSYFSMLY
ncbi:hypothetical protein Tco_0159008 [Tanacetum coccineum]